MIRKFSFQNYKGFDQGNIELKPITILLGANSSGKSSILQLLLLFEQTINYEKGYESALKLNGKYTNLGETENIFRNKNVKEKLSFAFDIDFSSTYDYMQELRSIKRNIIRNTDEIYYELKKIEERYLNIHSFSIAREKRLSEYHNIIDNIKNIKKIKREVSKKYPKQQSLFDDISSEFSLDTIISENPRWKRIFNREIDEYLDAFLFVEELDKLRIADFRIEYDIHYTPKHGILNVGRLTIKHGTKILIEYNIEQNKGHKKHILKSDIANNKILEKYRVKFGKNIYFDTIEPMPLKNEEEISKYGREYFSGSVFCNTLLRFMNLFSRNLMLSFNNSRINYISPLRAFPKRYYFLDESNVSSSLDSIDGDNLTEILKKEQNLTLKVNKWLHKFGLSVSVEDVKEVIHRLKITQNGLNLDITDVGFGISQVLPIIVQGFLSQHNSLTIIEQPEIHLHPMMQAELADLFIDVVTVNEEENNKILLIETHSESILKRLRRRIAEKKIKHEDVAIYFVHNRQKKSASSKIESLQISETGAFDWPKEFYTTDLEDTTEFLKYQ